MLVEAFLDTKPLYYDVIDYERMPKAYESIRSFLNLPKIIHIVGTNGKGTTGRFLATMLHENGLHVGHYTSPHILKFNERIWLDGHDVKDHVLEAAHQTLLSYLAPDVAAALSYFEYTTFLAMVIFSKQCDYVVLEAGLGGEYDATNVFPKVLSIVTPIGLDHQAFLGEDIEAIAQTKINSVCNEMVLAKQYAPEVALIAHKRSKLCGYSVYEVEKFFDEKSLLDRENDVTFGALPVFLKENFKTAYCALRVLGYDSISTLKVETVLKGRCQKILPNVTIDVGHNSMAAEALVQRFAGKKICLVYNSYKDKDFVAILTLLKPIIDVLFLIDIQSPRAALKQDIEVVAHTLGIDCAPFYGIEEGKEYLVFGSFSVVEAFLRGMK
ncbi:bifunctional folylpolyglutamate synthase/dihydrofolate synthase [Sulfurospirillum barnesii]|uniref:Folylpolyglutamate synthase/dihydrofolate synthase n=1 Tax=Sulfurospirillum barnesii (strain ATCC 700032 / DSM 10660 / SES-3) TaxID=760154 RepID=I3XYE7_SULBS|nr:bifunctional folylpolyglutamate synthase/dihydrofolate synthase [Sulfurospirillum barnesii]AFL68971.1 folylpolyglutamate synthase/dihydrofolate synthase [Sulfurospirillum barnesii SES-3]